MKKIVLILNLVLCSGVLHAQLSEFDSLKNLLNSAQDDETKFKYANKLVGDYLYSLPDTALIYIQQEILLAKKIKSDSALSIALIQCGILFEMTGNSPQAIQYGFDALKIAEHSKEIFPVTTAYYYLSSFYEDVEDYKDALIYSIEAKDLFEKNAGIIFF